MGVFRRKDRGDVWTYRFWRDNEEYKGKCLNLDGSPAKNKAEAKLAEARALEAVSKKRSASLTYQGQAAFRGGFTLAQAFSAHGAKLANATRNHQISFKRHAREAMDFFGADTPVTELRDDSITAFVNAAHHVKRKLYIGGRGSLAPEDIDNPALWKTIDKTRSKAEINHVMNALRSALKAAHNIKDSITGASALPFPPTVPQIKIPKRKPTPMRADEFARRYAVAPVWVRDAMDLMRHFGLRLSEALSVRASIHVNYKLKCLTFRGEEVKSGDDEHARGGSRGWAVLERLIKQAKERGTDYLVAYPGIRNAHLLRDGKPLPPGVKWRKINSIRQAWINTAKAAGITNPTRAHDLRAAYITELEKELGPDQWRKAARHSDIKTTLRYSDPEEKDIEDAIERATSGSSPKIRRRALAEVV